MNPDRFAAASDFAAFLASARSNTELWQAVYRTARVPQDLVERGRDIPGDWKLVALVEDWCGDAVSVLPLLAKFVELLPNFELKLLARDENPDLMDAHLAGGTARAIPVVIAYNDRFEEVGWWGPRPTVLQDWFDREGRALEKGERYKRIRQWYARDRGRSTLDEILRMTEEGTGAAAVAPPAQLLAS